MGVMTTQQRVADNSITTAMLQDNSVSLAKLQTQIDFGTITVSHTEANDYGSVTGSV